MLIYVLPIVVGGSVFVLIWYALLCVLSSFAINLKRKRELFAFIV